MKLDFSIFLAAILLGGVLGSARAVAQNDSIGWRDFSFIKQSEPWLTSYNAAGLKALSIERISIAEWYASKQNGKFVNYYQSDNSYEWGVQTESFYRLNPKVVFYGKVSYSNFNGKNMGGSVFINPSDNPFDIVQYDDSTQGKKTLENYRLIGAVSGDIAKGVTIGGKIDYTAANYAKQKDLRHRNKLLDMYATLGLLCRINDFAEFGANYYYRRSVEGLDMSVYGTTGKPYHSLINYGAFYGVSEEFGADGYTKNSIGSKPLFNEYQGGAMQLKLNITPRMSLFNEIAYRARDGYFGKHSPSDVVYSKHNSNIWEYHGVLSYRERKDLHALNIMINYEKLENFENVYKTETPSNGISHIVYYDPLKRSDKTYWKAQAEYVGNWGISDFNPVWVVKGGVDYFLRKQTVSIYPYFRKQTVRNTIFHASTNRNVIKGKNRYSVFLEASYLSGRGTPKNDGLYVSPSDSQVSHKSLDQYLYSEYEYLTKTQVKGNIGFKYSRPLGIKGIVGYTSLHYSLQKAFDVSYIGGDKYHELLWTMGCTF